MKLSTLIMQWTAFASIVAVIFINGFWPDNFKVSRFTIVLLFLLAIPLVGPYLRRAKGFFGEFEFKDDLKEAEKHVAKSEEKKTESRELQSEVIYPFETFSTHTPRELLAADPSLALAALRIEIERVLLHAVQTLVDTGEQTSRLGIIQLTDILSKCNYLNPEQTAAIRKITGICNKAVHGIDISEEDAATVINLTERLNNSFPIGYSINIFENPDYAENGFSCEWEHCIEHSPVERETSEKSCPLWGHNCPGGLVTLTNCRVAKKYGLPENPG